jgi:hypothetical protein
MYPAKYSFNPIGTASCASDFVIYGLNVAGSSSQANLVGVNNLYVGPAGTGCGSPSGSNGGSGSAPTPEVMWAFNVAASGIGTSVVLSLDGTKVGYVVNSDPPVLQVLTLPSTQSGTVTSPTSSSTFGSCGAAAPSVCTVTLSSSTGDTYSSPFVDYATDTGYVGDDSGNLYKITHFFSVNGTAPARAGGSWPVSAGSSALGAPVYDAATNTVFVGSYDGNLYGFNATTPGTGITGSPRSLALGGGNSKGLLPAPPIVDATNHVLYEFFGANAIVTNRTNLVCTSGNCAEVAQVAFTSTPTFSSSTTTVLTTAGTNLAGISNTFGSTFPITTGAFSQSYFTGFSDASSFLYLCGAYASGSPTFSLLQFNFDSNRILQTTVNTVDTRSDSSYSGGVPFCSPLTEFYNSNQSKDWLFFTTVGSGSADIYSYNITGNTLGGGIAFSNSIGSALGATGLIVDGDDPLANASSVYSTSGVGNCIAIGTASPANSGIGSTASPAICAYKYTQNGLQ